MESATTITLRRATAADAAILAALRIDFLLELLGPHSESEIDALHVGLLQYYAETADTGECTNFLAFAADAPIACGSLVHRRQAGGFKNPGGRLAYVLNMYTQPAHRRQGIARRIMEALVAEARAQGLTILELHAAPDGVALYEELGFQRQPQPMYRLVLG